jgi:hypothetical protein
MLCQQCNGPITGYGVKFCSRSCSATSRNLARARPCQRCGGPLSNPTRARKYCTSQCYALARYETKVALWLEDPSLGGDWWGVNGFVRRWLGEQQGECCWICGWSEVNPATGRVPVQVDHIDGDPYNQACDNLRLLCPNCHSLTSTFGNLNRGNGRIERRKV